MGEEELGRRWEERARHSGVGRKSSPACAGEKLANVERSSAGLGGRARRLSPAWEGGARRCWEEELCWHGRKSSLAWEGGATGVGEEELAGVGKKELAIPVQGGTRQLVRGRSLPIDLFDLVEQLHKVKLTLGNLDMDSIYVKNLDGSIKLLVLLTEVKLLEPGIQAMQDQNHVSEFINFCAERHSVAMDPITLGFSYFIKQEFCTSDKLRSYPDDWDDYRKGEFLMSLQNMHPRSLRELFKNVDGIGWPVKDKYLPKILSDIVEVDSLQGREHNLKDFSDYVNLLRNRYKHFNGLPDEVKAVLVNRKGLVKIISEWTPNFWIVVYERTGHCNATNGTTGAGVASISGS
ncbi:Os05g0175033 [Oryza sativa Japonica Group]|uniref:Os05g0175033 protein n=1 Tax=Oryza sativa subsp. japonica TaxID=39947 RepID=A0A0P0WIN3_ORYSJ|nr:Os05g0175033 [Oryza sativa Japonica Group]